MNKLGTWDYSNELADNEVIKNNEGSLEYCDLCFIALGSQEKRAYIEKKAVHPDCAKKTKSS